jgi:hypothetical protein
MKRVIFVAALALLARVRVGYASENTYLSWLRFCRSSS